jgi:hypothetical protein
MNNLAASPSFGFLEAMNDGYSRSDGQTQAKIGPRRLLVRSRAQSDAQQRRSNWLVTEHVLDARQNRLLRRSKKVSSMAMSFSPVTLRDTTVPRSSITLITPSTTLWLQYKHYYE